MSDVAHLYRVVQDQRTGKVLSGVTVALCEPGTQTPITTPMFTDEAMTQPLGNPYVANNGIIDVYLAQPRNVAVKTTYGSSSTIADNVPVLPHAEFILAAPVPVTITNGPGTGTVLVGDDASTAHFAAPGELFINAQAIVRGWCYSGAYALQATTRDINGALLTATVQWPDGTPGEYTVDTVSTDFPGKVDAYHITYGDPVQYTLTQAAVTRDSDGNITVQPVIAIA